MNALVHLADQQLVALYQEGNNAAFEVLLRRYKDELFTRIMLLTKNQELAEDLFQETFLKVILMLREGKYAESGKFFPWLCRVAHNLIVDYYRRQRLETVAYDVYVNPEKDSSGYDLLNNARLSEKNVEQEMVNEQVLRDAVRLLTHLPQEQQAVVRMRLFDNMSFREIAEREGIGINTALGRMRYAVQNMQRLASEADLSLQMI